MIALTGGEKYNVKEVVININKLYPNVKETIDKENLTDSEYQDLYKYTLEIFTQLSKLNINTIDSNKTIQEDFNKLQSIHYYSSAKNSNKSLILEVSKDSANLVNALISLIDDDTEYRNATLKQIMSELGIVDTSKRRNHLFD